MPKEHEKGGGGYPKSPAEYAFEALIVVAVLALFIGIAGRFI